MSPFLRELRNGLRDARITLVVKDGVRDLVELCPHVDEVLGFPTGGRGWFQPYRIRWRALRFSAKHLRPRGFDTVLLPRWDVDRSDAMVLGFLSGASQRVGYSIDVTPTKAVSNRGSERLLTTALHGTEPRHEVERNLDLLRALGIEPSTGTLELWTSSPDQDAVDRILSRPGEPPRYLIGLGIGAGAAHREWPVDSFRGLIRWLVDEHDAAVILVGGPGDFDRAKSLMDLGGDAVIDAVGRCTLRQTGLMLGRCHLFVGNDSGPMHLAAAAGTSAVEISCQPVGADPLDVSAPERFAPWGVPSVVLRPSMALPPCEGACGSSAAHCIRTVSVEDVKSAVLDLLERNGPDGQVSSSTLSDPPEGPERNRIEELS